MELRNLLHRGDFGCGPTKPAPGSGAPEPQRLPAPSRNGLAVGVRTSLRCGSRRSVGRHSLLRLAGLSPETPLTSEEGESIYYLRYVVNNYLRYVAKNI